MSSYLRNVFVDLFSSMAPGNMKSEFIGLQRSKLNGKSYSTRNIYVKSGDVLVEESVSVADKMHQPQREGVTFVNPPETAPTVAPSATAMVKSTTLKSDNAKDVLMAGLKDGACAVPETIGSRDKITEEITHLKVLSMLHLDVIEQQQQQIQLFEKEAQRLKAENETLKCRLERMNRRTHLAEKVDQTQQVAKSKKLESPQPPKRKYQRHSDLDTPFNSPHKIPSPRGTPSGKVNDLNTSTDLRRKQQRRAEKLAKKEEKLAKKEEKLAKKEEKKSATNRQDSKESREDTERFHRTDILYPCLSDLRVHEMDPDLPDDESAVQVPSWRIVEIQPGFRSDTSEACDEATFEHRHGKLEVDERKRKRWDFQRIRDLREHERLVNKQKRRELAQWRHILTTFYPEDHDAEHIEVSDTVPLITFGVQVPSIKPSEFELPWFNAKEREKDEQRRRGRRSSRR